MILKTTPIDFMWPTQDPFLFCAHHNDVYPAGDDQQHIDKKYLKNRNIGQDFVILDGFRMYHGKDVPGFPVHPHRGFETITIVRKGFADHADSLGAAGRYGEGDVQWMTAGSGVQHSEMFPLINKEKENHLELFQIWLNLPAKSKMVPPDFKMLWSNEIPHFLSDDNKTSVNLICGEYNNCKYYEAPKNSWANNPDNEVAVLLVKIKKDGVFNFPKSHKFANRSLYFFSGKEIIINDELIPINHAVFLDSSKDLRIIACNDETEFLLLSANPINEPVVQYGPFVMNTREEISQTFKEYQETQFGGWPWNRSDMTHGPDAQKFAKYPNGEIKKPK